ncbi:MAG: TetR/AcrR family transcriptional regulator [Actinomycetota bacterium]|nr:TetR/AcrR family transcriptional regulator [Actinomycetota bacterium]
MAKTPGEAIPSRPGDAVAQRPVGRPAKRSAITRAARTVFGREGYVASSIDAIAAEANVSKRTIYNHFDGKEQLFCELMVESATQVADRFVADVERAFTGDDAERDLTALGRAFAAQRTAFPEHFAMVVQVRAQERHFPPAVLEAWQQAGPLRVRAEVARRLDQLAERDLLHLDDPVRAALHFGLLVTADLTRPDRFRPPTANEISQTVATGVDAFLNGYRSPAR